MIEFSGVSYSYGESPALRDVSFSIEAGESVCLLGPNGSGKSTLLRVLNGLIFPTAGKYFFEGREITPALMKKAAFAKAFHQRVGFVFQDSEAQLFCPTVYDEVAFGPRQMGLGEDEVDKRTRDCLSLLGVEALRGRQPYHLSGGEKKKVAVAATLALNPSVLVLDEPMNSLDPRTARWLGQFLLQLESAGKTLIVSTHDLSLAAQLSRRAILFDESHALAADGETGSLLKDTALLEKVNLI
jgi:cobalt/nickel transport system ATP-binding protein